MLTNEAENLLRDNGTLVQCRCCENGIMPHDLVAMWSHFDHSVAAQWRVVNHAKQQFDLAMIELSRSPYPVAQQIIQTPVVTVEGGYLGDRGDVILHAREQAEIKQTTLASDFLLSTVVVLI